MPGNSSSSGGGGGGNAAHDQWLMAVSVLDDCAGAAALYASDDLRSWRYTGDVACMPYIHVRM